MTELRIEERAGRYYVEDCRGQLLASGWSITSALIGALSEQAAQLNRARRWAAAWGSAAREWRCACLDAVREWDKATEAE